MFWSLALDYFLRVVDHEDNKILVASRKQTLIVAIIAQFVTTSTLLF